MLIIMAILILMIYGIFDLILFYIFFHILGSAGMAEPFKSAAPASRSSGVQGVSNLHSDFCRFLSPSRPRHARRPYPNLCPSQPQAVFLRFLADFLPIKNSSQIRPLKKPPKISKIDPPSAQSSILRSFGLPFIDAFSRNINFLQTCIFPRQEPNIEGPDASNLHQKSCFF